MKVYYADKLFLWLEIIYWILDLALKILLLWLPFSICLDWWTFFKKFMKSTGRLHYFLNSKVAYQNWWLCVLDRPYITAELNTMKVRVANNLEFLRIFILGSLDFLMEYSMNKFSNPNPSICNLFSGRKQQAEVPRRVGMTNKVG